MWKHFRWTLHNLIGHPLSEIVHLLSGWTRKGATLSLWIHDITMPTYEDDEATTNQIPSVGENHQLISASSDLFQFLCAARWYVSDEWLREKIDKLLRDIKEKGEKG